VDAEDGSDSRKNASISLDSGTAGLSFWDRQRERQKNVMAQWSKADRPDRMSDYWLCQCDCGKQCICRKENLRSGVTRSCGCLQEAQRKVNMKKAIHFMDGTCVERIACRKTFSNNTSGHRGVYRRENNRWRASIGFQGKSYNLGSFATYEEAVQARLDAEKRLYDPFLAKYHEENS